MPVSRSPPLVRRTNYPLALGPPLFLIFTAFRLDSRYSTNVTPPLTETWARYLHRFSPAILSTLRTLFRPRRAFWRTTLPCKAEITSPHRGDSTTPNYRAHYMTSVILKHTSLVIRTVDGELKRIENNSQILAVSSHALNFVLKIGAFWHWFGPGRIFISIVNWSCS